MTRLNIGEAAAAAGVTPKMVRHYESLGLIPAADRTEAGYRLYGPREIARLKFIRQCRTLGFPMEQVAALLLLWTDEGRSSRQVKALAQRQLEELEARRRELEAMRETLSALVAGCAGDERPQCPILSGLAARAAEAGGAAGATGAARRSLKQVAPGTRRPRPVRQETPPAPAHTAHALMAWSHAAARSWGPSPA